MNIYDGLWLTFVTMVFLYFTGELFRYYIGVLVAAIRNEKEPDDNTFWKWTNFIIYGALTLANVVKLIANNT